MPGRRPDQKAGGNAEGSGKQPAEKAWPDRRGRLGDGDREHEGEERGRRSRRRQGRDDPEVEHAETDHCHGHDGSKLVRGGERADHDEDAARGEEREIAAEPYPGPSPEFHQEQQGERSERGEQADLAVREGEMRQREDARHDHGRPH